MDGTPIVEQATGWGGIIMDLQGLRPLAALWEGLRRSLRLRFDFASENEPECD